MKIYIISTASYSEDGDLDTYAQAFKDLILAKASLKTYYENHKNPTPEFEEGDDEYIEPDDQAWISEDGMRWGTSGPNQFYCEIIEQEIE